MAMDATLQVRMDGQIKNSVEELYRSLGTSFAEAVRIFAQQSLLEGGMPFRPTLKPWEELTDAEIDRKLAASGGYSCGAQPVPGRSRRAAEGKIPP